MIELSNNSIPYFISDLHISHRTPKTLQAFEHWIATVSSPNSHIFILGDLFEIWFGDDYTDEVVQRTQSAFIHSKDAGSTLYFMQGNRDFLIGDTFCKQVGFKLLTDPDFIQINQHIILLTHGDQLCVDDQDYQRFRHMTRSNNWIDNFLSQPLADRIELANSIREHSERDKSHKKIEIMDISQSAVNNAYLGHWPDGRLIGRSNVILHGHTHRCAVHGLNQPGLINQSCHGKLHHQLRFVLPDWDFDYPKEKFNGGYLTIQHDGTFQLNLLHSSQLIELKS